MPTSPLSLSMGTDDVEDPVNAQVHVSNETDCEADDSESDDEQIISISLAQLMKNHGHTVESLEQFEHSQSSNQRPENSWLQRRSSSIVQRSAGLYEQLKGKSSSFILPKPEKKKSTKSNGQIKKKKAPTVEYVAKSLFCLRSNMWLRQMLVRIIHSKQFEKTVLLLIMLNCINMVFALTYPEFAVSVAAQMIEILFTVCFLIELIVKVMAMGLIFGDNTYLRSAWNIMDFFVVITGLFGDGVGFLRCLRLLRPLRTLNKFPGMKVIVETIARSMAPLRDAVLFGFFVFSVYSIVGMNFFAFDSWNRCRVTEQPTGPGVWEPVGGDETASQLCGGGYRCEVGHCGNLLIEGKANVSQAWEEIMNVPGAYYGLMGFHNFPSSLFTVFVVSTLDSWQDIAWRYMDSMGGMFPTAFFLMLVLVGHVFIVNLAVAILWEEFASHHEKSERGKENALLLHSTAPLAGTSFLDSCENKKAKLLKCLLRAWRRLIDEIASKWIHRNFHTLHDVVAFCEQCELHAHKQMINPIRADARTIVKSLTSSWALGTPRSGSFINLQVSCQARLRQVVDHKAFKCLIFLSIAANSVTLGMDQHPPPSRETVKVLHSLSSVFTTIFTFEALLKVMAYGFNKYIADKGNLLDMVIVVTSLVEVMIGNGTTSSFTILRGFRLLRVVKLMKSSISLRIMLEVLGRAFVMCASFLGVAAIFFFIFTLLGMQLFAYRLGSPPPGLHFDDPLHAFISVFTLVTGDNWTSNMFSTFQAFADESERETGDVNSAWYAAAGTTIGYYLTTLFCTHLVLLQLFLAMLASSFMNARQGKVAEYHSMLLDMRWSIPGFRVLRKEYEEQRLAKLAEIEARKWCPASALPMESDFSIALWPARYCAIQVISHWIFDASIVCLILASSIMLAFDSPYVDPNSDLRRSLNGLDTFFSIAFALEMLLKMFALGIWKGPRGYFKDNWNRLDFIIVTLSLISTFVISSSVHFRAFRALRVLRPLRLIKRNKGMKTLVTAVIKSIKPIIHLMLVSLLVFYALAVLGMNFFKGKLWSCSLDEEEVSYSQARCEAEGGQWKADKVNFDAVPSAMYAMFQLASGSDVTPLMLRAESVTDVSAGLLMIVFVIVGHFIILNLFIGIIVDEMMDAKKEADEFEHVFETREEQTWRLIQTKILSSVLIQKKVIVSEGSNVATQQLAYWQRKAIILVESKKFEFAICSCIAVNALSMCLRHATMSKGFETSLQSFNSCFAIIFAAEMVIKVFALRRSYFNSKSNIFDFLIVLGTTCLLVMNVMSEGGDGDVGLMIMMPVMRCFRLTRLLRLVGAASMPWLRLLVKVIGPVLPAMVNVSCVLLLIVYIYSVLAVSLFGKIMPGETLTGRVHFQDFGTALFVWLIVATGNIWNTLIWDCALPRAGCVESQTYEELMRDGPMECGTPAAILVFASFMCVGCFVAFNFFIGVILDTFQFAKNSRIEECEQGLTELFDLWTVINPCGDRLMALPKFCMMMSQIKQPVGMKVQNFDGMLIERKYRKILRQIALSTHKDMPMYYKNGQFCVHLQDVMLFIARRICAWRTRPIAFMYQPASTTFQVRVAPGIKMRFNLRFPEMNMDGSILVNCGESVHPEWNVSQYSAAFVIRRYVFAWWLRRACHSYPPLFVEQPALPSSDLDAAGEMNSSKASPQRASADDRFQIRKPLRASSQPQLVQSVSDKYEVKMKDSASSDDRFQPSQAEGVDLDFLDEDDKTIQLPRPNKTIDHGPSFLEADSDPSKVNHARSNVCIRGEFLPARQPSSDNRSLKSRNCVPCVGMGCVGVAEIPKTAPENCDESKNKVMGA